MSTHPHASPSFESVPQLDLAAQYAAIGGEIRVAIEKVLASQQFVLGSEGAAFEQEIASLCGVAHGVGVGSGTDALVLALRACGVGPGDEVLLPPFTFVATGSAVSAQILCGREAEAGGIAERARSNALVGSADRLGIVLNHR